MSPSPVRPMHPSLQALHAASAPPSLAVSLDELEEVIVAFGADLNDLVDRVAPLMHPAEDDAMTSTLTETTGDDTAPAVRRVQDARRQLRAMHVQLFDIASRLAL